VTTTRHLNEWLVHLAMEHLLPSTLDMHANNAEHYTDASWIDTCDDLGRWEDREGCSTEFLQEHGVFADMARSDLAPIAAAAMRLIREMGEARAFAIVAAWQS